MCRCVCVCVCAYVSYIHKAYIHSYLKEACIHTDMTLCWVLLLYSTTPMNTKAWDLYIYSYKYFYYQLTAESMTATLSL